MTRDEFEEYLTRHYVACWKPLLTYTSPEKAQDALQTALEQITRTKAWERFDLNGSATLTTYLCRAAFLKLLDSLALDRREGQLRQQLTRWLNVTEVPSQGESTTIQALTIEQALNRFREPLRTFVQSYVSGYTLRELGQEFGLTHETVRKRLIEAFTVLADQ